jgi:uncharacterized protein YjbI with pentapeptide repeats
MWGTDGRVLLMSYEDLRGQDLRGWVTRGSVFEECDMRGCDLRGCDLRGASFHRSELEGARLEGALCDHTTDLSGYFGDPTADRRPRGADFRHWLVDQGLVFTDEVYFLWPDFAEHKRLPSPGAIDVATGEGCSLESLGLGGA